ncbi:hypothetical protein KAU40_00145 [Candidatus Parcubacteria bacterium]|nr:hypothetical protein [Candidatus Parcubacteria bacterium]
MNTFIQWLSWQFFEMPQNILSAWRNFLLFNLNYFSIPLLLRTFFSPWRKYKWSYGKGFDFAKYIEVFFSNFISRVIGAILRTFLIIIGIIIEIFIIFIGAFVFLAWLILPMLLIFGIYYGCKIFF